MNLFGIMSKLGETNGMREEETAVPVNERNRSLSSKE
jgi:hypothetical protein